MEYQSDSFIQYWNLIGYVCGEWGLGGAVSLVRYWSSDPWDQISQLHNLPTNPVSPRGQLCLALLPQAALPPDVYGVMLWQGKEDGASIWGQAGMPLKS